ncbi:hypothetical protein D3C80_1317930 [compost metagenome]
MGLVAQHGGGIGQRAALFAGALAVALYRNRHLVDHAGHFGRGFPQRLAGFFTDAARQFIGIGLERGGKGFEHTDARLQRLQRPAGKGLTRGLDGAVNLLGAGALALPDNLLANRIERLQRFALPCLPAAGDKVSRHYLASRAADSGTARTWSPALRRRRLAVCGSTTRVPAAKRAGAAVMRQSSRLRL